VLGKVMRLDRLNTYMSELTLNPKMKQKDICKKIGVSQSTLSRYQKELGMNSFHKAYNNSTRSKKSEGHIDISILDSITPDESDFVNKCLLERESREIKKIEKEDDKKE